MQAATETQYAKLNIDQVSPSPTNPRKHFDQAKLAELTESVKARGVLQPILVRMIQRPAHLTPAAAMGSSSSRFEIVAGERRFRAAKAAGLEYIPAIVQELSDKDVLEIQLIENVQREDLDPIEEAEGYALLCREHGYRAEDLALKVDRSVSYIYSRIKLTDLPESGKVAVRDGRIPPSTGLLIARIPNEEIREQACKAVLREGKSTWQDEPIEPMSYREAKREIEDEYMLDLANAQFPIDDPDLVPAAGGCLQCPKRTGNQPTLFADVEEGDLCTDPVCFRSKGDAHWVQLQESEKEKGNQILGSKETKAATTTWGGLRTPPGLIELEQRNYEDPKNRNYQKLLGKDCPPQTVARDPASGKIHRFVREVDVNKVLKEKYDWATSRGRSVSAEEKKQREQAKVDAEVKRRMAAAIVAGAEDTEDDWEFWQFLVHGAISRGWHDTLREIVRRRGLTPEKQTYGGPDFSGCLEKAASQMTISQLRGLLMEITVAGLFSASGSHDDETDKAILKRFAIDRKAIRQGVEKELKAKKPAPKTKPKKGAASAKG